MIALLIIVAFAVLNRVRGGGLGGDRLPGHPRFWCAPVVAAMAYWHFGEAGPALWFAGVWLGWAMCPWGDLYMMGRPSPDGRYVPHIGISISGLLAIGLLSAIALIPIAGTAGTIIAIAMPAAYEAGWQAYERRWIGAHTVIAEPIIGAAWGVVLCLA